MAVAGDSVTHRTQNGFLFFPLDCKMQQSPVGILHRCDLALEFEVFSQVDARCARERNLQRMLFLRRITQSADLLDGVEPSVVRSCEEQVPANG